MDLSPAQRKLVFAAVVAVLAALGTFLIIQGPLLGKHGTTSGGGAVGLSQPLSTPSSAPGLGSPKPSPGGLAAGATPRGGLAAGAAPPPGAGANIYQWLPFTRADLTEAAGVVRQFSADYATYSYTESADRYVGRMRGLITPALAATLARSYATPGVAQARTRQKQTATGSGVITALRAFGASSLTFLVTLSQKTYSTPQGGKTTAHTASGDYAITIARSGSGWQVNDIQLASAGNS